MIYTGQRGNSIYNFIVFKNLVLSAVLFAMLSTVLSSVLSTTFATTMTS
jgi:hypothetical protein